MRINYWHTLEEGRYYHIYNRANGSAWLFANEGNYQYFLKKWQTYFGDYLDTLAYCLIHNHFHFIVRVKKVDVAIRNKTRTENSRAGQKFFDNQIDYNGFLEDQFRRFFHAYSAAFNKQHERHGSLFQPKFKRVVLPSLERVLDRLAYVHHNPLHHNYTPFYEVWTYSSYATYLSDKPTSLSRKLGLSLFGRLSEVHVSDTFKVSDTSDTSIFIEYHKEFHQKWINEQTWDDFEEQ